MRVLFFSLLFFSYNLFSQQCKLDIVIAFDVSGSNTSTTCLAANEFLGNFLVTLDSQMDGSIAGGFGSSNVQVGICTWTTNNAAICDNGGMGNNIQVSPMTTSASVLKSLADNSSAYEIAGVSVGGSDFYQCAVTMGMNNLNDFVNSSLGDRSLLNGYKRLLIIVTDANSDDACTLTGQLNPLACMPDMFNDVWQVGSNSGNSTLDVETIAVAVRNSGAPPVNWQAITNCIIQDPVNQFEGNGATLSSVGVQIANNICQPSIIINNICENDTAFFYPTQSNIDSVSWDFGDPSTGLYNFSTEYNSSHIFSSSGIFPVTLYTYLNGSINDTVQTDVEIYPIPYVDLGNQDFSMCIGDTIVLNAFNQLYPNTSFLWQDGSTDSVYYVTDQGSYTIDLSLNGCNYSDSIDVVYYPSSDISIGGDFEVCFGDPVFVDVSLSGSFPLSVDYTNGIDTFNIMLDNSIFEISQSGTYEIFSVIDNFGCEATFSGISQINIEACTLTVNIPNSFTPNLDTYNEGFRPVIYDINNVSKYEFRIYDRWGELIFETDDKYDFWYGVYEGSFCQLGVYVYYLSVIDIYDNKYNISGTVLLLH